MFMNLFGFVNFLKIIFIYLVIIGDYGVDFKES